MHAIPVMLSLLVAAAPEPRPGTLAPVVVEADAETQAPRARATIMIDREALERSGKRTLGEVLQRLPLHGNASNALFGSGGDGAIRLDLRNLGPQRTLVLVDGHRYMPTMDGSFDLSTLPLVAIDRIEIDTGADAAAFGAGASAGVVRIVTRRRPGSSELHAAYGRTTAGDGAERTAEALFTAGDESRSITATISLHDTAPIEAQDRDLSSVPVLGIPPERIGGPASPSPWGTFFTTGGIRTLDRGAEGCLVGQQCPIGTPGFRRFDIRTDGFNTQSYKYLSNPRRASSISVRADTRRDGNTFGLLAIASERSAERRSAPRPISARISPGSIYHPFARPVTSALYQPVHGYAYDRDEVTLGYLALDASREVGPWTASAALTAGRTDHDVVHEGAHDRARLARALGPSYIDAAGRARCGTPAAPVEDCIPMNLAGGPDGFTPEMLSDVLTTIVEDGHHSFVESVLEASIPTTARSRLALRGAGRRESAHGNPPTAVLLGQGALYFDDLEIFAREGTSHGATLSTSELSGRWIAALGPVDLQLGAGWTDHSRGGATPHALAEVAWAPLRDLTVTASWSSAPRTPAISELAARAFTVVSHEGDPCSNPPEISTPVVVARCASGIGAQPALPQRPTRSEAARVRFGGSPDLENERTRSWSVGLDYTPSYVEGLNLRTELYRIEIANPISADRPIEIMRNCYLLGLLADCARFTRDETGVVSTIDARLRNVESGLRVEGADLALGYSRALFGEARLELDAVASWMHEFGDAVRSSELPAFTNERPRGNRVGTYVNRETVLPRWRAVATIGVATPRASVSITGRYTSPVVERCDRLFVLSMPDACGGLRYRRVPSSLFLDAAWVIRLGEEFEWRIGVDNLADRAPAVTVTAIEHNFDVSRDAPGRFVHTSLRWRF